MKLFDDGLVIKVVNNQEDLLKAFLVRGIVYMHEQECPYVEEFDLNDFTSTQVIGLVHGEPVLTARIRYFQDFAKFERLAVRSDYRGLGYGHRLLTFMLELVREKGFRRVYLHAQARLKEFYEGYGFVKIGKNFDFSEHDYYEMICTLDANENSVGKGTDPIILNRPEGMFNRPGPIELGAGGPLPLKKVVE